MNAAPSTLPTRLAPVLNASCQCIWLDRARLRSQLREGLGEAGRLIESRPGLVSGSVVFLDHEDAVAMDRTIALVHRALTSAAFLDRVAGAAPPIARLAASASGGILGFDFHLGAARPQLIEINTNPGGLLVNLELARAVAACCDCLPGPLSRYAGAGTLLDALPERIVEVFRREWRRARNAAPPGTIAIVDDAPGDQYLYPEFLLYQRLFARAGWDSVVADAARLEVAPEGLLYEGRRIDFVYNRVTDFYLADERHAALREACERDLAVVAPRPADHARWADKRLLASLRDPALLEAAGLDADERGQLVNAIPHTEVVTPAAAEDFWRRRKDLFFKPVDGYGSKAAYRGDKLTRSAFEHVTSRPYVAQSVVPTSRRHVVVGETEQPLRVDVRSYTDAGETLLRAARLYRGQTTNFRTPGGGFAPVLTLPEPGRHATGALS